jgi:anti-sigma B factor antagonist
MTDELADGGDVFDVRVDGNDVAASGELDADTAPRLADVLADFDANVRLDMSGIEFIDSSGLRVLIETETRLSANSHHLTVAAPSPQVQRVLELASLDTYLTIER